MSFNIIIVVTSLECYCMLVTLQQVHSRMLTTVGLLDPPLGNTRLQVSKLFATLFAVDDSDLHLCLIENNVVNKLLVTP